MTRSRPQLNTSNLSHESEQPIAKQIQRITFAVDAYARQQKASEASTSKHNRKMRRWTRAATIGSIVYTGITALILVLTIQAVREAGRQADVARDSEIVGNRSVVISNKIQFVSYGPMDAKFWRVSPVLENVGNTITKGLHYTTGVGGCLNNPRTPVEWGGPINWIDTPKGDWIYNVVGPKADTVGASIMIHDIQIKCFVAIPSAGLIKYHDIFGYSHITEFCDFIPSPVYSKIDFDHLPIGDTVRLNGFPCPYHNCTDEECGADWEDRAKDLK